VAKKSKTEPEKKEADAAGAGLAVVNGSETAEPKKKSRPAAAKPKAKKPAAKKTATTPARSTAKKAAASSVREPSDEEIRLRAYFLAERRHQLSLPGDSAHDWIEARRQLIEEAGR
jgi:hypothetical protein